MKGKLLVLAAVALTVAVPVASHAVVCPATTADAGAASPNLTDPSGDWAGPVNDGAASFGDLYREGIDVTAAWISGGATALQATIQLNDLLLGNNQINSRFYLRFIFPDTDGVAPDRSRRWVSGALYGYKPAVFEYGYLATGVTGGDQFFQDGFTTGSVTAGPGGLVTIDIPTAAPTLTIAAGASLSDVLAESRVLTGSPEPLPPPSPVRHGFVWVTDDTNNGDLFCDAIVAP